MKNKICLTILILLFVFSLSFTSLAKNTNESSVITVNPFGFIVGSYNIDYEKPLNFSNSSLSVGGTYFSMKLINLDVRSFGARAGMRFYKNQVLEGVYYGPVVSGGLLTGTELLIDNDVEFYSVSFGGVGGYQWITQGGFVIDLNIGVGYNVYSDDYVENGFGPLLNLKFGVKI